MPAVCVWGSKILNGNANLSLEPIVCLSLSVSPLSVEYSMRQCPAVAEAVMWDDYILLQSSSISL